MGCTTPMGRGGKDKPVRLEKKRILKEDGRYLLFYHSAASASPEQQKAFDEVTADVQPVTASNGAAPKAGTAQVGTTLAGTTTARTAVTATQESPNV
jgi:hypothetical protein